LRRDDRRLHRAVVTALDAIEDILDHEEYGSVVTFVDGPQKGAKVVLNADGLVVVGSLPSDVSDSIVEDALKLMGRERHSAVGYEDHSVFIETLAPPQDLMIFGAVHIGQALATFAELMGYRVSVIDSRSAFATEERFPSAHRVLVGWPSDLMGQFTFDRRTWVVVLSHDQRHEDPVLEAALKSPVRYIGAMGSRRNHGLRVERLGNAGFTDEEIARIHSPIGLDIGAESPQEVAVSILAEMTLIRYGSGTGLSLKGVEGRVHKQRTEEG
jgi:xanthine dehydrogenase accessory factor